MGQPSPAYAGRTEPADLSRPVRPGAAVERAPVTAPITLSSVLSLQRSLGNAAVTRLLQPSRSDRRPAVQRDDPSGADAVPPGPDAVSIAPPPDFTIALPGARASYAMADLQSIDPSFGAAGVASASPAPTVATLRIQRQAAPSGLPDKPSGGSDAGPGNADQPHLSSDVGISYPWSASTTIVYRNLNFATFPSVLRGLDILHEPQATFNFTIAPDSLVSTQLGIGLVNLHLPSLFGSELEAQIPLNLSSGGASGVSASTGLQLEQHIWKGISATVNLSGTFTVPGTASPPPGTPPPAEFQIAPGAGLVIHTDAF